MKRIGITLVVLLVGAACSSTSTDTTVGTTVTTVAGAEVTTTVAAPSTTTVPPTTAPVASVNLAECVVGTWDLDSQPFLDQLSEMASPGGSAGGEIPLEFTHLDGKIQLTLGQDGTLTSRMLDWTFGTVTPMGSLDLKMNQTQEGTYTLDGDTLTTQISDIGSLADIEFSVDGKPFEFPAGIVPIEPPDMPIGTVQPTCGDDIMTFVIEEMTITWFRVS